MNQQRIILPYEAKALTSEIADVDVKNGIVTGYYSTFNNIDAHRDMIVKGAFAKTIAERGPKGSNEILHLLQHDPMTPIGKPSVLKEDDRGLYFETKIVGTQAGIDTLKLYEAGVYNQHSIGFKLIRYEYVENEKNPDESYFILSEIKLFEGSTVAWGANSNTPMVSMKAETREDVFSELDKKMDVITKALRIQGLSDDAYKALEIQSAQIKSAYRNVDSLITSRTSAPASSTSEKDAPDDETKRLKEAHEKDEQQTNQIIKQLQTIFSK